MLDPITKFITALTTPLKKHLKNINNKQMQP